MNEPPDEADRDAGTRADRCRTTSRPRSYGGGHIKARHGRINRWLLVVYLVMFVWALYYGYVVLGRPRARAWT